MKRRWGAWSLGLLVAMVYAFFYIPIIVLTVFSFNSESFPAPWVSGTVQWYVELWRDTDLLQAFTTSCIVALSATLLSLAMGIALMYYLMQGGRVARVMRLFYVNLIVPEIVLAVGLLSFFTACGVQLGLKSLIIGHTVLGLGYVVPLVYQKYLTIEPQLIDASLDLGATMWQTFRLVMIPLLRPALMAGALLVFIISFDDFILSYFCAGSSAKTLPIYIVSMMRTGVSPLVNALSTCLLLMSSLLVMLFCYYNIRSDFFAKRETHES